MLRVLFRLTISLSGAAALLLLIITLLGYFFPDPTKIEPAAQAPSSAPVQQVDPLQRRRVLADRASSSSQQII